MKNHLVHGLLAGILAGLTSILYHWAYREALLVDFSPLLSPSILLSASMISCLVASLGYHFFSKWVLIGTDLWFNTIFLVLVLVSLVGSFAVTLPEHIQEPELFPGLSVPMHLFPMLFWLITKPLTQAKSTFSH